MQRLALYVFLTLSALGLTACAPIDFDLDFSDPPPPTLERRDIESADQDALVPGAKASWAILPRDDLPKTGLLMPGGITSVPPVFRSEAAPADRPSDIEAGGEAASAESPRRRRSRVQFTLSLDADYAVGLGADDGRTLGAFEYIDYTGMQAFGPTSVGYRYDLHLGSSFVRTGVRFFDLVALEGLGGVSVSAMDLQVRSPGAQKTQTVMGYGGNAGLRLTLTPHQVTDLYAQFQLHLLGSPQTEHDLITVTTFEAGAALHLLPNVSVFGGWRTWNYGDQIDESSDVQVKKFAGPTFGALLRF